MSLQSVLVYWSGPDHFTTPTYFWSLWRAMLSTLDCDNIERQLIKNKQT